MLLNEILIPRQKTIETGQKTKQNKISLIMIFTGEDYEKLRLMLRRLRFRSWNFETNLLGRNRTDVD